MALEGQGPGAEAQRQPGAELLPGEVRRSAGLEPRASGTAARRLLKGDLRPRGPESESAALTLRSPVPTCLAYLLPFDLRGNAVGLGAGSAALWGEVPRNPMAYPAWSQACLHLC